jgi:hypothetical protein
MPTPKEAATAAQSKPGHTNDDVGKDGVPAEWSFDLDYTDGRGRLWQGRFRTHILTIGEKAQVGLTRARLAGGVSPAALDQATIEILEMQAHLAVCLDEAPEWAKDLLKIRDIQVLGAIYKEVLDHEDRFWSTGPGEAGEGPSPE